MLFWEALLSTFGAGKNGDSSEPVNGVLRPRLPFDCRCSQFTKDGKRCKGKVRPGSEFCLFHDPTMIARRQAKLAVRPLSRRSRLAHLPDGYLRKLSNVRAVGQAMDRLYREVRLGIITPEMGLVLFAILTRILDYGFDAQGNRLPVASPRTKAGRVRPKLADLLTRSEKIAWRRAVAGAPKVVLHTDKGVQPVVSAANQLDAAAAPMKRALTAS